MQVSEDKNIAWYRRYRPKNISDYMGDDIKQVVQNRFTTEKNRPNVMMVQGTRGCGKTSFARIISKYYLCESPVDGEPCEECEICQTINDVLIDGETGVDVPGVVEVDATVMNGKEAIQEILDDAILEPMYTKYKVLIVDEVHMVSNAAQNSMLKIIEDIPEFLIVIFATTNPEKVLGTIHSRCQIKLEVKKKTVDEMADRLEFISQKEGLTYSKEALKIIAKKADRVPRESINLLENIAKTYGNQVTLDNVREMTGDVAAELYMDYFESANTDLEDIIIFNQKLKEMDITAGDFISGLTRFVLDSLYIRHGIALEDYPKEYVKRVKELFNIYKSSEFDTLLQVIENASKSIGNDDNKNELIITTTAMRIGKIGLLASGLGEEAVQAEKENKKSIGEYRAKLGNEIEEQIEKVNTFIPAKEKLAEMLKGLTEVTNTEAIKIDIKDKERDGSQGEFFSADALDKMLKE